MTMLKLWLTYAHADNLDHDVDFVAQELGKLGIAVHLDRWVIGAGRRLWEQIEEGIKSSDAWLIYATSNSLNSEACKEELAYATDKALSSRGGTYPVIALFPGGFDSSILPSILKVRLCISTADTAWRERVLSAMQGRPPEIQRPHLDPFLIKVHHTHHARFPFSIETRPRAGVWSPFIAAVPIGEGGWNGDKRSLVFGATANPAPDAGSALFDVFNGTEGEWSFIRVGNPQPSPTLSAYIHCQVLPSRLLFGAPKTQYIAESLDGVIQVRLATNPHA